MPSTTSPNKNYELQATGENQGTWGILLNAVLSQIDLNMGGRQAITIDAANVTLTDEQCENVFFTLTGTLTGNRDLIFPATSGGFFFIYNNTSGAFTVTAKPSGGTGFVCTQGAVTCVFINPTSTSAVGMGTWTAGVLDLAHGGTGSTTASAARTALGLGTIATQAASAVSITGGSITGITDLAVADGGTGSSTAANARTALGVAIGSDVQAYSARLAEIAALAVTDSNIIVGNGAAWVAESGATARTSLGLGSIATQASSAVSITGGSITGITDLAVADGGTGASTAANARTNLGLVIGTNVQAWDAGLDDVAALAVTDGNFIVGNGAAWVAESGATARTSLGLGTISTQASSAVSITGGSITGITDLAVADGGTGSSTASAARTALGVAIGTNVQAFSARLGEIAALAVTDSNIIVGNGAAWVAESGATARTSLGLGSIATQASSSVSITGGSITGITDLAVADGGTGASTAANARTNLGLGTISTQASSAVSITGGSITGITDLAIADGGTGASSAAGAFTNIFEGGIPNIVGTPEVVVIGLSNNYGWQSINTFFSTIFPTDFGSLALAGGPGAYQVLVRRISDGTLGYYTNGS